MTELA